MVDFDFSRPFLGHLGKNVVFLGGQKPQHIVRGMPVSYGSKQLASGRIPWMLPTHMREIIALTSCVSLSVAPRPITLPPRHS